MNSQALRDQNSLKLIWCKRSPTTVFSLKNLALQAEKIGADPNLTFLLLSLLFSLHLLLLSHSPLQIIYFSPLLTDPSPFPFLFFSFSFILPHAHSTCFLPFSSFIYKPNQRKIERKGRTRQIQREKEAERERESEDYGDARGLWRC